jgi:predicted HTH domain antitoxin
MSEDSAERVEVKRKLDVVLTEIERVLLHEEAVRLAGLALRLVKAELKKSGNWTKKDFGWPEVRLQVRTALAAITLAEDYASTSHQKEPV